MSNKKLLAVASGGGHWKQLMLIRPAFSNFKTHFITTINGLPEQENIESFSIVRDSNKTSKFSILITAFQILKVIYTIKPKIIISTGAGPGLIAIAIGRLFGAKTIWIDSIANGEELSLAGRISKKISNEVLSQWEDVANNNNVNFKGSVL